MSRSKRGHWLVSSSFQLIPLVEQPWPAIRESNLVQSFAFISSYCFVFFVYFLYFFLLSPKICRERFYISVLVKYAHYKTFVISFKLLVISKKGCHTALSPYVIHSINGMYIDTEHCLPDARTFYVIHLLGYQSVRYIFKVKIFVTAILLS